MTAYRNIVLLPRELRGEPATGDTCHHGRALTGEGCPACGVEAGEHVDRARVELVWLPRRLDHPDLTNAQRDTLARLVKAYGAPFAMSVVAGSAIPAWQNVGPVSVRIDGAAHRVPGGEIVAPPAECARPGCRYPAAGQRASLCAAHHELDLDERSELTRDRDDPA